jgi:hypothetical protein
MAGVKEKRTKPKPGIEMYLKTMVEKTPSTRSMAAKVIFWVRENFAFIT